MGSLQVASLDDPRLAEALLAGNIGVLPTDTVYGLVARLGDLRAVTCLYAAKPREHSAGTIIAASVAQLRQAGFRDGEISRVATIWPAPLSVVMDATNLSSVIKGDRTALPVRIPDDHALRQLLVQTGPLMTTSANPPGEPTATSVDEAMVYFGDRVDFYVDGGDLSERPPSTIIGFDRSGQIEVYRQGAADVTELLK